MRPIVGLVVLTHFHQQFVPAGFQDAEGAVLVETIAVVILLASEQLFPIEKDLDRHNASEADLNRQFLSKIPLGRWGRVEEVGRLALYLCSDDAGFITGTDILIDGGWTAQ